MEEVFLHSLSIAPNWKRDVEHRESSTITDELKYYDTSTDPMEMSSVACATDVEIVKLDNVQISERVISLMEQEMLVDDSIISRLNSFHVTENVRLQPLRTTHQTWLSSETAEVTGMSCDSFGRIAFLLGEVIHETWCSHEAKVVLTERSKIFSLPLSVCPCSSAWSPQSTAAVGLIDGQIILLKMTGEVARSQVHSLAVSAVEWISSSMFASCSYDGTVVISQLKSAQIEMVKSIKLSVADLPKRIKNNSSSGKPLSLVALSRHGKRLLVASETGGSWLVTVPDLELSSSITNEPTGISNVMLAYPYVTVASTEGSLSILGHDGTLIDIIPQSGHYLLRITHFLVAAGNERIQIYDLENRKLMMEENFNVISICSNGDEIITLDEKNTSTVYRLLEL